MGIGSVAQGTGLSGKIFGKQYWKHTGYVGAGFANTLRILLYSISKTRPYVRERSSLPLPTATLLPKFLHATHNPGLPNTLSLA